jgi:hypothetical protein
VLEGEMGGNRGQESIVRAGDTIHIPRAREGLS